ncbi:hypothetical protein [Mucilaginibacter hurinus]|nr:hypothetical protein [Mucilaginibacter hurinus]
MNKFTSVIVLAAILCGLTRCKKDNFSSADRKTTGKLSVHAADPNNLIFEPFDYTTGKLNGTGGWTRIGGTADQTQIVAGNLSYEGYLPGEVGNKVELLNASNEDLNLNFGERSGAGTRVYASMLINVSAATATGDYFAHFFGSLFKNRIMVRAAGEGINIGLDGGSGTATWLPDTYSLNQTYLVVTAYEFVEGDGNDIASLWVNPDLSGAEPAPMLTNVPINADVTSLESFRLRQNVTTTSPTLTVDGIKVGLTWAGSVLATEKGVQPPSLADSVTVDFTGTGRSINHVASGFLHGFTTDGIAPHDSLVLPLKIFMVRATPPATRTQAARMKQLGIKQQLVLSDNWYFGYTSPFMPGDNGDWKIWETFVKNEVNEVIKAGITDNVEFDIWNEADHPYFWPRPQDQILNAYFRAYRIIRQMLPKAVIVAPSLSSNNANTVINFLDWAKRHGVVPDVISWHFPSNVIKQVEDIRVWQKINGFSQIKININEYTLVPEQYAGKHAWLIAQMERAQVDAAIHAAWSDQSTGTLNDILTPTFERKASWWVYKGYGDVTGKTVTTIPGKNVDLFAGKNAADKSINILLGAKLTLVPGDVKVKFAKLSRAFPGYLPPSRLIHVQVQKIGENGGAPVNGLETVYDAVMPMKDSFDITFPWLDAHDAYVVHITEGVTR